MCGDSKDKSLLIGARLNCSQGLRPRIKEGVSVSVRRCRNCNLIYPSPLPFPDSIQDHYGIPPEDYWARQDFSIDKNYFSCQIEKVKSLISFRPGMTALDIGAGMGQCMIALSNAGFDVQGFEPSVTFRDKAIELMKIDSKKLKLGGIEDIDYPEKSFDFITFGAVLEHLHDPSFAIENALRWLKPEGVIHIEVPSSNWLISRLVNLYYRMVGVNYVTNISPMHSPFHIYEFSPKSFSCNGKRAGYKILDFYYDVCSLVHIPKLLHPVFRWYMSKTKSGMQLTVFLSKGY